MPSMVGDGEPHERASRLRDLAHAAYVAELYKTTDDEDAG